LAVSIGLPLGVLAALLLGLPPAAQAANIVVTPCHGAPLRPAIAAAGDGDEITFSCNTPGAHTIVVTQTQVLHHNITLNGGDVITVSRGRTERNVSITAGHVVTITNLTLAHGQAALGSAINVFGSLVAQ